MDAGTDFSFAALEAEDMTALTIDSAGDRFPRVSRLALPRAERLELPVTS